MSYSIKATAISQSQGTLHLREEHCSFGITQHTGDTLPSPADVYLSAMGACILKNVERFSSFMKFEYEKATVTVSGNHVPKPPMLEDITYHLIIFSNDQTINLDLLQRNLARFGTIYNMVSKACEISGTVEQIKGI